MPLYFKDSRVPELAALTRRQRRLVREGSFAMLRAERPTIVSIYPILAGSFGGGMALVGNGFSHVVGTEQYLIVMVAFGLAGAALGGLISAAFLTRRLRPYFRRFIQQHVDEIRVA